jgi:hypothetical protein
MMLKFKERHLEICGEKEAPSSPAKIGSTNLKLARVLRELSSDEDSDSECEAAAPIDPKEPWMREFNLYLNTTETVPKDMSIIQWWGVCAQFYPCCLI